jgi:hypothetical protein
MMLQDVTLGLSKACGLVGVSCFDKLSMRLDIRNRGIE